MLRIDHARVIDTSFVFEFENAPKTHRPSLNNLCKASMLIFYYSLLIEISDPEYVYFCFSRLFWVKN